MKSKENKPRHAVSPNSPSSTDQQKDSFSQQDKAAASLCKKDRIYTDQGVFRVEWADKYKTRVRRLDQNYLDKYYLDGKITEDQHSKGVWYLSVATRSQITSSLVSNTAERVSGGKKELSNAQINARMLLKKIDKCILKNGGADVLTVVRNTIVYDQSMRDLFTHAVPVNRREGFKHLRKGLDIIINEF